MWLHVGILSVVELADALDSKILNLIDNLATAIVASSRVALSILISTYRAHSSHHLVANEVLRCDKLDSFGLT